MNENTEEYKYELDTWEGGTLVTPAKVDLTTGIVTPAVYSGNTPITPERLEIMNQGIKKLYEEGAISKDIYIGPEEEAPSEAKIIIDSNKMQTKASEVVNSLEGNETDKAPSVQTINNEFSLIKGQILWTNPDPTQNISADYEINLSSADYDLIEVIYQYSTSGTQQNSSRAVKGKPINLQAYSIGSNMTILVRRMDYINDTKYKLTACSLHQVIGNTVTTNNTSGAIPLYIVGYKTGLFSKEVNE